MKLKWFEISSLLTLINSISSVMAMLTGSLCRAFSSTTPRFGARLAPLLGRKSSRWWQRLERNGGDGGEGCKAGVAHLKTLQLSWEIHGEGRDGFLKSHMV